jgi:hypothetical protein
MPWVGGGGRGVSVSTSRFDVEAIDGDQGQVELVEGDEETGEGGLIDEAADENRNGLLAIVGGGFLAEVQPVEALREHSIQFAAHPYPVDRRGRHAQRRGFRFT